MVSFSSSSPGTPSASSPEVLISPTRAHSSKQARQGYDLRRFLAQSPLASGFYHQASLLPINIMPRENGNGARDPSAEEGGELPVSVDAGNLAASADADAGSGRSSKDATVDIETNDLSSSGDHASDTITIKVRRATSGVWIHATLERKEGLRSMVAGLYGYRLVTMDL